MLFMKNLLVCFAILLVSNISSTAQTTSKNSFNIVLITIDTLRADHLSCYGYERETSPNIDKVAEEGILFKNVIAPSSWTSPSMVSLFTSTYPINHGVVSGIGYHWNPTQQEVFSSSLTTLTETLKSCGYTTFGVTSNLHLSRQFGFARGFDNFECLPFLSALDVNKSVLQWEEEIKSSNKYFLWIHYFDPHFPYTGRRPWIENYINLTATFKPHFHTANFSQLVELIPELKADHQALSNLIACYDSEINYVDSHLGEIIKKFDLEKNTLLIITSDHGEEFLDHGYLGHGSNLHQETINIPLVVKMPSNSRMEIIERHVNLVDIMPSILGILNINFPEQLVGQSLWEKDDLLFWFKKTLSVDGAQNYNYSETAGNNGLKTIITPQWKYIFDYNKQTEQLYNIKSDPLELNNLSDKEAKQRNKLKENLFKWVTSSKHYSPKKQSFNLSKEDRRKFEALGYFAVKESHDDDDDDDYDGITNEKDNCSRDPNGPNKGFCTSGYIGEPCISNDECGDGGFCSMNQEDKDRDGFGDVCDFCKGNGNKDTDGDGLCDKIDNCYNIPNPDQKDDDGDGIGDVCNPLKFKRHWLEAEWADTIVDPLRVADDESASEGKYICASVGAEDKYSPSSIMAIYKVNIEQTGSYIMWGRVKASRDIHDSFFIQVDYGSDNLWEVKRGNYWHWDKVSNRGGANPVKFILTEGVHTLKVKLREKGTKLDKILLTNDLDFVPSGEGGVSTRQSY